MQKREGEEDEGERRGEGGKRAGGGSERKKMKGVVKKTPMVVVKDAKTRNERAFIRAANENDLAKVTSILWSGVNPNVSEIMVCCL